MSEAVTSIIIRILLLISRTQTENFITLQYGKNKPQHEDYPYSYKRHGEK